MQTTYIWNQFFYNSSKKTSTHFDYYAQTIAQTIMSGAYQILTELMQFSLFYEDLMHKNNVFLFWIFMSFVFARYSLLNIIISVDAKYYYQISHSFRPWL